MKCPACKAENADDARRCAQCGEKLARGNRRPDMPHYLDTIFSNRNMGSRTIAATAYRLSLFGVFPFAGLLLGPVALVLGLISWRWEAYPEDFRGPYFAEAAMLIGGLLSATNWGGLLLMLYGLGVI
jgi:hypothetical protein